MNFEKTCPLNFQNDEKSEEGKRTLLVGFGYTLEVCELFFGYLLLRISLFYSAGKKNLGWAYFKNRYFEKNACVEFFDANKI